MRVIINADDFGYSHDVNVAIETAIIAGKISSSTIMPNGPAFEEAVQIAKKYESISFGVHLNIIEFAPLSNTHIFEKYKLIGENGMFIQGAIFAISCFTDELKCAIKHEWSCQIKKLLDSGIKVSHLDSHQHTHSIPALQEVLLELMDEYGIHKCRRRIYFDVLQLIRYRSYSQPKYDKTNEVEPAKKSLINKVFNHFVILPYKQSKWLSEMKKCASIPDDIVIYQLFVQDLSKVLNHYRFKTIEAECHPGLLSNVEETQMVMNDAIRQYAPAYQLINYFDL